MCVHADLVCKSNMMNRFTIQIFFLRSLSLSLSRSVVFKQADHLCSIGSVSLYTFDRNHSSYSVKSSNFWTKPCFFHSFVRFLCSFLKKNVSFSFSSNVFVSFPFFFVFDSNFCFLLILKVNVCCRNLAFSSCSKLMDIRPWLSLLTPSPLPALLSSFARPHPNTCSLAALFLFVFYFFFCFFFVWFLLTRRWIVSLHHFRIDFFSSKLFCLCFHFIYTFVLSLVLPFHFFQVEKMSYPTRHFVFTILLIL